MPLLKWNKSERSQTHDASLTDFIVTLSDVAQIQDVQIQIVNLSTQIQDVNLSEVTQILDVNLSDVTQIQDVKLSDVTQILHVNLSDVAQIQIVNLSDIAQIFLLEKWHIWHPKCQFEVLENAFFYILKFKTSESSFF